MNLAIIQQQQIDIPENSWAGHTTMAGFGLVLLLLSFLCLKGNKKGVAMGPWSPPIVGLGDRLITEPSKRVAKKLWDGGDDGFDWKSAMTFFIGLWAMTSIMSSTGSFLLDVIGFTQKMILGMSDWPLIADLGTGGLCFILLVMAMWSKDNDRADLAYGAAAGFLLPLGGGIFTGITFQVGQWIPQIMQIG